jgi:serine/threonine-protein kinase RsbT
MIKKTYFIKPKDYELAGYASSNIKKILKKIGYDRHFIKRVCSASYEAEINIVIHSNGGIMTFECNTKTIKLYFVDYGPGILDVELAMTEGYSTATDLDRQNGFGAGMGLANIKRQADVMDLRSSHEGTILYMCFDTPKHL